MNEPCRAKHADKPSVFSAEAFLTCFLSREHDGEHACPDPDQPIDSTRVLVWS